MRKTMDVMTRLTIAIGVLAFLAGCGHVENDPVPVGLQTPPPAAEPGDAVMAYVNGEPVSMAPLVDTLVAKYGLVNAEQLIANAVVEAEAEKEGITVSEDDIIAEYHYFLETISPNPSSTTAEREQLLGQILTQRNLSRNDFEGILRRDALLRKLVSPSIVVAEADLRDEFDRLFGKQVQVRHIQVSSLASAQQVQAMALDGQDFIRLVRQYSENPSASSGGLLPPFGHTPIMPQEKDLTPAMRRVAMSMTRVGQISEPVRVGSSYHVLYLERIIPAEGVDLETVRPELELSVRKRLTYAASVRTLHSLIQEADVRFVNPILAEQDRQRQSELKP
jgi:foldase protein PrsA